MPRLRVAMSPAWSALFFGCSVLNFYVYGLTHDGMQAGLGVLMGVLGLAYAFGAVLVIEDSVVLVKNPLGMTMKTYVFQSPHDLSIEGRKLWVQTSDRRAKVNGMLASAKDWRALREAITTAQSKTAR